MWWLKRRHAAAQPPDAFSATIRRLRRAVARGITTVSHMYGILAVAGWVWMLIFFAFVLVKHNEKQS
jgi:hypothetical protein